MIEVNAGARIHIALADMALVSPRTFGGVGFMIDFPAVRLQLQTSQFLEWRGIETLDDLAQTECCRLAESIIKTRDVGANITIATHPPQHVGFGTKTALMLSLIAGLHTLIGVKRNHIHEQRISRRGGASGIGVHGFYRGGVIWDAGHPRENVHDLLPSGASAPKNVPPLMLRIPFPTQWRVGLCLPEGGPIAGPIERAFFKAASPVDVNEVMRAMAALYHGVLPAFRLRDLKALRVALSSVSATGFKALEIDLRGVQVTNLLSVLFDGGYAAGMSSLGPLVYVVFDENADGQVEHLRLLCERNDARWLGVARGLNQGARVIHRADK
jgi:beta-ribofuranosylaminobenzene 5'-phosphate synthase